MAHLVSEDVLRPGFESRPVTTETQKKIHDYTFEDVEFALRLLAYYNTKYTHTSRVLENDYGLKVHPSRLREWVTSLFTQRYVQIQHELSEQVGKKLSSKLVDIAAAAADVQETAVEKTLDKMPDVDSAYGASIIAQNMSRVIGSNIEKANLIEERPTQITEHRTPDDALAYLREKGLLKEPEVIDAEVVED